MRLNQIRPGYYKTKYGLARVEKTGEKRFPPCVMADIIGPPPRGKMALEGKDFIEPVTGGATEEEVG